MNELFSYTTSIVYRGVSNMSSKRRQEHNQEKIIHKETYLSREAIDELNASQKDRQNDIAKKEDRIAEAKAQRAANQPPD